MNQDSASHDLSSFDRGELLARCIGRVDLLERVLKTFERRFGEDLEQLERDLRSAKADDLACVAHRMKGSSANVAAPKLSLLAADVEELARLRRFTDVSPRIQELRDEFIRFCQTVSGNDVDVNAKSSIEMTNE